MIVSMYFLAFIAFSFLGWVYESAYCTIKDGKWSNRGFLFGPVCPIYGSGAVIANIIFRALGFEYGKALNLWKIFLICMIGSAVLEYVTSYVLEKLFHAIWWDYSGMPLNINGRICLPASIFFGFGGIFVVKYLSPFIFGTINLFDKVLIESASLLAMAVLAADISFTVSALTELTKKIEEIEANFNEKMEASYQVIEGKRKLITIKVSEYEKLTKDKIKEYAFTLNKAQKGTLDKLKRFTGKGTGAVSERIKEAVKAIPIISKKTDRGEELKDE